MKSVKSSANSNLGRIREMPEPRPKLRDNPYTISKVITLSTRILDMKIQLNEYLKANAELQE